MPDRKCNKISRHGGGKALSASLMGAIPVARKDGTRILRGRLLRVAKIEHAPDTNNDRHERQQH